MTDSQHRNSEYERNANDKYYTEYWCTEALMRVLNGIPNPPRYVWEPAAGGGHIVEVLQRHGCLVYASDVDTRDYPQADTVNFLTEVPAAVVLDPPDAIITNPPYKDDLAEMFCRRALEYKDIPLVAMLMRSDFKHAVSRVDLWKPPFAFEVCLLGRPRWDAWYDGVKAKSSGMHNYSWYVWDRRWDGVSTTFHEGKIKPGKKASSANIEHELLTADAVAFEDLL
jgi:hypothetical protein